MSPQSEEWSWVWRCDRNRMLIMMKSHIPIPDSNLILLTSVPRHLILFCHDFIFSNSHTLIYSASVSKLILKNEIQLTINLSIPGADGYPPQSGSSVSRSSYRTTWKERTLEMTRKLFPGRNKKYLKCWTIQNQVEILRSNKNSTCENVSLNWITESWIETEADFWWDTLPSINRL